MPRKYIIQIYEVASPREAASLVKLGVDNIGSVIISEREWKQPAIKDTVTATQELGAKSSIIPLFNNVDSVLRIIDHYRPDIIHFCEALVGSDNDVLDHYCPVKLEIAK